MTLLLSCMWPNFRPFPSVWLNSLVIYSKIRQNCSNSVESKPNYDFQTNIIKWWRYKDYAFFIKQTGVYSKDAVFFKRIYISMFSWWKTRIFSNDKMLLLFLIVCLRAYYHSLYAVNGWNYVYYLLAYLLTIIQKMYGETNITAENK